MYLILQNYHVFHRLDVILLLISDNIEVRDIQRLIEQTGGELLDSTWLFDVYGSRVEQDKRSLALQCCGNIQHVRLKMLKLNLVWITLFKCWKTLTKRH